MSTGRTPDAGRSMPTFIDPKEVDEVFADEILSVEVGGGVCTIVSGKRRIIQQPNDKPPIIERRVTSRLVLSIAATDELMKQLTSLKRLSQQHQALVATAPAGVAN